MRKEYSDYLKFIDDALGMAKSIPKYFSKFSNKIYCNHQKLAIYVLMQKSKTTTRGIVSILKANSDMRLHLGLSLNKSCKHESQDFEILLKDLKVNYVLADKGYSSKKSRKFVLQKLNAVPVIPRKANEGKYYLSGRKFLKFNKKKYAKRGIIENVFFCIKQKYGSVLRNKSCATQKVEAISKLIAHNVDRMQHLTLLILKGLHQRPITIRFKLNF